ncbi:MAG: divalent cation tolerance protein CutA [Actinobacteria bacterium]|nr:divalent cation tolerance protein CutA [Actinomycetota bacterium]
MNTGCVEVVITADDADWLADYTRQLVEDRLAACGQNISTIRSIYHWEGKVQDEREARVALHTRAELVPEIIKRTNAKHAYDVPCVIAMPISEGNPDYLSWVRDSTRDLHDIQA